MRVEFFLSQTQYPGRRGSSNLLQLLSPLKQDQMRILENLETNQTFPILRTGLEISCSHIHAYYSKPENFSKLFELDDVKLSENETVSRRGRI